MKPQAGQNGQEVEEHHKAVKKSKKKRHSDKHSSTLHEGNEEKSCIEKKEKCLLDKHNSEPELPVYKGKKHKRAEYETSIYEGDLGASELEGNHKKHKKHKKHKHKETTLTDSVTESSGDPDGHKKHEKHKHKKRKLDESLIQTSDEMVITDDGNRQSVDSGVSMTKKKKLSKSDFSDSEKFDEETCPPDKEIKTGGKRKREKEKDRNVKKMKKENKKDEEGASETLDTGDFADVKSGKNAKKTKKLNEAEKRKMQLKKREKRKEKMKQKAEQKLQQQSGQSSGVALQEAIQYLQTWKNNKESWNFQKVRQVWLLKHMYHLDQLPAEDFEIMLEYMEGMQGNARTATREQAEKLLTQMEAVKVQKKEVESEGNESNEEQETEKTKSEGKMTPEEIDRVRQVLQILT